MTWNAGRARGWIGEELAAQFLAAKGYSIVGRNQRYGKGELDIICRDGDELVFVEVKTRKVFPEDGVVQVLSVQQERMLKHTADGYMQEHVKELTPVRFDVVGIVEEVDGYQIRHIEHAF